LIASAWRRGAIGGREEREAPPHTETRLSLSLSKERKRTGRLDAHIRRVAARLHAHRPLPGVERGGGEEKRRSERETDRLSGERETC
jgi:hypothetical protein